jgi:proteasome lid subunit RPN8/RPN11
MITMVGVVKLNLDLYKIIIASTARYANARIPEADWAEVYGLLYGYNEGEDVNITGAVPFTHTRKKGHILKVEFDEEDYALAAQIETDEYYTRDPPQYIVGWYHSHPGIKIMLSQDDVKNQLAWQTNNPLAIALVFDPIRLLRQVDFPDRKGDPLKKLENDPGFEIYRLNDVNRGIEAAYHRIAYEFTDYALDEALIQNAQEFVGWVTKAFPREGDIVGEYERFVDTNINKLDQIYNGTQSYLQTLMKKHETHRIPSVLEIQIQEATKILEQGNYMVSIFRMMTAYLEFKEREAVVPKLDPLLTRWEEKALTFVDELKAIPGKIK